MAKTRELSAIKNYELRGLVYIHESFEIILQIKAKSRKIALIPLSVCEQAQVGIFPFPQNPLFFTPPVEDAAARCPVYPVASGNGTGVKSDLG